MWEALSKGLWCWQMDLRGHWVKPEHSSVISQEMHPILYRYYCLVSRLCTSALCSLAPSARWVTGDAGLFLICEL